MWSTVFHERTRGVDRDKGVVLTRYQSVGEGDGTGWQQLWTQVDDQTMWEGAAWDRVDKLA